MFLIFFYCIAKVSDCNFSLADNDLEAKKMIGTSPRAATVFTGVPDGSTKHLGVLLTAAQTLLVN